MFTPKSVSSIMAPVRKASEQLKKRLAFLDEENTAMAAAIVMNRVEANQAETCIDILSKMLGT